MTFISYNGRLHDDGDTLISCASRLWRYGDGVFETIRIVSGRLYLWEYHRDRLQLGLDALGLTADMDDCLAQCRSLIAANAILDGGLRLAFHRKGGRGYLPDHSGDTECVIETFPLPEMSKPLAAMVSRWRRIPPACLPTACKTAQSLNSILARQEAEEGGFGEALMLSTEGALSSFASGNMFWWDKGSVCTPPLATGCLAGVTRRRLMELSDVPIVERFASLYDLATAEAVVLTGSLALARAVASIDGVGDFPESGIRAAEWSALLVTDMDVNAA